MSSLRTFRIEFDRSGATYAPGELVAGKVILDLAREKTVRALKLTIKGEAAVNWRESRPTNVQGRRRVNRSDNFRANENYFNFTYCLVGNTGGNDQVRLPAGYNQYPFTFLLPHNIPCSFEHTNGHIRYTTKAIIDRPWRFDHESKIAFTVVASYDLNERSQQCLGIYDENDETFCCLCCAERGLMKMCIQLPTTGFVPGQSIETMINLVNTTRVDVTQICVKMERSLKFHASTPYSKTKTDKVLVKQEKILGPFGQAFSIATRLQVPPIPPSQLECCKIIDQIYSIRITAHVSGMHCSISKSYPILIGTIPLRSVISSAPGNSYYQQNVPQPSAPMVQNDDPPPPMPADCISPSHPGFSQPIGFVSSHQPSTSTNQWDMPPPSYEECMQRTDSIKDDDESNFVHGANEPFAPRYPVFNFPPSDPPGK